MSIEWRSWNFRYVPALPGAGRGRRIAHQLAIDGGRAAELRKELLQRDPTLAALAAEPDAGVERHQHRRQVRAGKRPGDVAAHRRNVAQLVPSDLRRDFPQHAIALPHRRCRQKVPQRGHRPDREAAVSLLAHERELGDSLQPDDAARRALAPAHLQYRVRSAGEQHHFPVRSARGEGADFGERSRADELESGQSPEEGHRS
jgi:hypothetical protein